MQSVCSFPLLEQSPTWPARSVTVKQAGPRGDRRHQTLLIASVGCFFPCYYFLSPDRARTKINRVIRPKTDIAYCCEKLIFPSLCTCTRYLHWLTLWRFCRKLQAEVLSIWIWKRFSEFLSSRLTTSSSSDGKRSTDGCPLLTNSVRAELLSQRLYPSWAQPPLYGRDSWKRSKLPRLTQLTSSWGRTRAMGEAAAVLPAWAGSCGRWGCRGEAAGGDSGPGAAGGELRWKPLASKR